MLTLTALCAFADTQGVVALEPFSPHPIEVSPCCDDADHC